MLQRRLGWPKQIRRSSRGSITLVLLVISLVFLTLLAPRMKLFRAPNEIFQARVTPQQVIANQLATEGVLAEHILRRDTKEEHAPVGKTEIKDITTEVTTSPTTMSLAEPLPVVVSVLAAAIPSDGVGNIATENPTTTKVVKTPDESLNAEALHVRVSADTEVNVQVATTQDKSAVEPILPETQQQAQDRGNLLPPTSVLHPNTPILPPLNPDIAFFVESVTKPFREHSELFPQHGKVEPGQHYRIESNHPLSQIGNRERDSVLVVCVFNDAESWGTNRSLADFFDLIESFEYPMVKISIALLTSSMNEFVKAKQLFRRNVNRFTHLSVIFRNDFAQDGLTRENRHAESLQGSRRRMLARYRNYALFSTLERWHQHVLWLDADVNMIPAGLLLKMTQSGFDILEPMCVRKYNENDNWYNYDLNAWVGQRKVRPAHSDSDFVPGPLNAKNLYDLRNEKKPIVPLDSVGGTMLYVRAEVHRQGVLFPAHYVIGSEWGMEGYDGIETEGLCYSAHFLGFKCWGMPSDIIFHAI